MLSVAAAVEAVVKKRAERNGPSAPLAVQFLPGHRADLFAARSGEDRQLDDAAVGIVPA